jgi:hypothetical protein
MLYILLPYYTLNDYDLDFSYCIDNHVTQFLNISSLLYNYNVYNSKFDYAKFKIYDKIKFCPELFFIFASII